MDIRYLLALQEFRNGPGAILAAFFAKMTFLGELTTALFIMAAIYWCIDKELGTYLLMGFSGNRLVNGVLKVTVCAYRPWIRDPAIVPHGDAITTATGYSFPSGHTMNAATVFGGGAVRKDFPARLRIMLGLMVVLVAFSRNFLGVHTPQDVLVGMIAGTLVMYLTYRLMTWLGDHPEKSTLVCVIGLVLAAAVALYAGLKSYPQDYDSAGKLIVDGAKMANDTFKGVGWCSAFLVGWILERRFVRFSTDIPLTAKLTRLTYGLVSYYAVSLILVPLLKDWIGGPVGTLVSCFLQMFYISFCFPLVIKYLEKQVHLTSMSISVARSR
ncbi:MAG: phosphatase PAP2 family protein [Lachnospiraceae bacterium]|nr:phosphatase PAP2 family protein [Lachnospiraceae bacterium]